MDVGDHRHEAVHVCRKCGWPFPNSHPSAKHRRAHKKVCGTIEGYKLVDSNDSDDENHSDEDNRNPSARVLERSGTGDRSNRSEDEVFTDAATEFADSSGFSPGVEERFVDARKSASSMERVENDDSGSRQSGRDIANADIIQTPSSGTDSYQMKNHEFPDCKTDQLVSTLQYEDDMPAVGTVVSLVSGHEGEESASVLSNDSHSSLRDSYPIKDEKTADAASHESEIKAGEAATESSFAVLEQDGSSRGNPEVKLDSVSEDILIEVAPKLETKTQDALSTNGVSQSEEDSTEDLKPKLITSDSYTGLGPVEPSDASFDTVQINSDAAQATDSASSNDLGEGGDRKEGNESVHVFSVPEDVYVVPHPEVILEGFKGHNGLKIHQPVPLDSCERIEDREADLKSTLCENSSSFQLKQLSEDSVPIVEDKLDDGSCKFTVKEVPSEGEVNLPEAVVSVDENIQSDVGVHAYAGTVEMKNNHKVSYSKEETPHEISSDSLQKSFPHVATEVVPDEKFMETSMEVADAGNYKKGINEKPDMAETENSEGVSEDGSAEKTVKAPDSLSNISEFQGNSMVNSSKDYVAGSQEHCENEKYDESENEGSGGPLGENASTNTNYVPEFSYNLQESQVAAVDVIDGSNDKIPENGFMQMGTDSDSSRVVADVSNIQEGKEDKTNVSNVIQVECVDGVSVPSESHHGEDAQTFQKASEYHTVEEQVVSPLDSAAVEESGLKEIGGSTSRIGSGTLQTKGDSNIATQRSAAAAADISVDLCSRTDSLEAHWGSVSVLSTQSDAPTVIDAESFPSTDSLAPSGEAETSNLRKLKGEPQGQCFDRSDVCEPPSFSTLAETGAVTEQKVDGSSIQEQRSMPASAQAGWFPTLTNVVNDSLGRKKNEEIIAKVTNWSSGGTGKQHMALKTLIGDASPETKPKSQIPKEQHPIAQKDDTEARGNGGAQATTVNSILGTESPAPQATKETGNEWNSPAKYPSEVKREKRKARPLWAPFVCCYSVN